MRRTLIRCATLIMLTSVSANDHLSAQDSQECRCDYSNFIYDDFHQFDTCIVTFSDDAEGRFTETFRIKGRVVAVISHLDRQGVWSRITFNGKPGMSFEINRYSYQASPMDLSESLIVDYRN